MLISSIDVHTIGAAAARWPGRQPVACGSGRAAPGPCPAPPVTGGGTEPTVTDANVFTGRVNAAYFLGGGMALHPGQAAAGAGPGRAGELAMEPEELADGILRIVNARMAGLMRQITIGRGLDPREFALIAYGGAGPMHAVFLAEELDIATVLVPYSPGTFSAQGMLAADISHDMVAPFFSRWDRLDAEAAESLVQDMQAQGRALLIAAARSPTSGSGAARTCATPARSTPSPCRSAGWTRPCCAVSTAPTGRRSGTPIPASRWRPWRSGSPPSA